MKRTLRAALSAALFVAPVVALAHGEFAWIGDSQTQNPVTGEFCCGERDCFKIPTKDLRRFGDEYRFKYAGQVFKFPAAQALLSRDRFNWACFNLETGKPRCLFLNANG